MHSVMQSTLPVLISVDDDPTTGPLLEAALDGYFNVLCETSGALALQKAISHKPDVIMLDLHMPNVDGFEVLRQLKQHPVTSSIPVICMSGDSAEATRGRAHALGAVVYLRKPLAFQTIAQDIQALLGTVNANIESKDGQRKFCIAYNHLEKKRLIESELDTRIAASKKAILLSLTRSQDLIAERFYPALATSQLICFQVKPSLISKFPFLNSVAPLIAELSRLSDRSLKEYCLIWDEPNLMLESSEAKDSLAKLETLRLALSDVFPELLFFSVRRSHPGSPNVLNELASAFCR